MAGVYMYSEIKYYPNVLHLALKRGNKYGTYYQPVPTRTSAAKYRWDARLSDHLIIFLGPHLIKNILEVAFASVRPAAKDSLPTALSAAWHARAPAGHGFNKNLEYLHVLRGAPSRTRTMPSGDRDTRFSAFSPLPLASRLYEDNGSAVNFGHLLFSPS